MKLRAAPLAGSSNRLIQTLSLAFPGAGTIGASASLGIAWANPANHSQQLDATKFDFTHGFGYGGVNAFWASSGTTGVVAGNPTIKIEMFMVDASGADLYSLGAQTYAYAAGIRFYTSCYGPYSFSAIGPVTPGNGIRCQITITGTITITIPSPWLFLSALS